MYKLIKLITILFSSKFVFQKPQNKKFLIFDNDHHQHLLRYFKKMNIQFYIHEMKFLIFT